MLQKIVYIISDIDKALAFEWIAKGIDKKRFDLSFLLIVREPARLEKYLVTNGTSCQSFYYHKKTDIPKILWQVYKVLKTVQPAIVHCHLLYGSLVGLTAARLAGVKKRIYTRHHSDYHHRYFPKGIKWDKWCNRLATKIIAPSNAVREVLMKDEGIPDEKIAIIHHVFDLEYFSVISDERIDVLKTKYQTKEHYPVVGVIARLTELKGIQYIIPAFSKLLQQYPNALLLIFNARGDYEREIKQQLQEMVPQNNYRLITFEDDLAAAYKLMSVFVQVSIDRTIEAFGQTYVEALAAGVPSVFTLSGIANDFIRDKENAAVVPFKNSEAIFKAMTEIINNEELRNGIIEKGRGDVAERFSINEMINKLEEIYNAA